MDALSVCDISKAYGRHLALNHVSFNVPSGSITALLGPNGAGKSSLMRIICGISAPSSGGILLSGERLQQLPTPVSYIGALLSSDWLDTRLTCEQIMRVQAHLLRLQDIPAAVEYLLGKVGLADSRKKKVKHLSLGMRQRLAVAVAMLGEPKVLILDEPVNGLDPQGVRWLRLLLHDFRDQGGTILISSHLIAEVQLIATDVVVINQGSIKFSGKIEDIQLSSAATQFECLHIQDLETFVSYLRQDYPSVHFAREEESYIAYGINPETIFSVASHHGVVLKKLLERKPSLEDMYFGIIEDNKENIVK